MLTAADEFLVHQTPYTFDTPATSDRNFYDRYFFNGYRRDGGVYFALGMGTYPNLGILDCAFSVVLDGKQRSVRASRALNRDRMNTSAGPISIEVIEPLRRIHVRVGKNEWGIEADLLFEARSVPSEEPHFFRRDHNNGVAMDYTRFTQHCTWTGTLKVDGREFDLSQDTWWGSRDHSWGIRNIGGGDPRGAKPAQAVMPQFFWNWAPLNFEDLCTLYTVSEYADGTRWHQSGVVLTPYPGATEAEMAGVEHDLQFVPGTRHLKAATIRLLPAKGDAIEIVFEPMYNFLMKGIGYGDPKWGHGMWVGPDEVDGVEYDLAAEDPMRNLHIQAVSQVTAGSRKGIGVFEIIVMGPHAKYGFEGLADGAK
jgi:hypothetical protein